jgi:hypothetical protein
VGADRAEAVQEALRGSPEAFEEDLIVTFNRSIVVHPCFGKRMLELVDLVGANRLAFESDFPTLKDSATPLSFVDEIASLPEDDKRKSRGGTLSVLVQCDPN